MLVYPEIDPIAVSLGPVRIHWYGLMYVLGFLVSCSCSYHLGADELTEAVQRSARHLDRLAQVVEFRGQAPDHPVHPAIAETAYLKALVCRVPGP